MKKIMDNEMWRVAIEFSAVYAVIGIITLILT